MAQCNFFKTWGVTLRTDAMKAGYSGELEAHQERINSAKAALEEFYAERHEDKLIQGEIKERMDGLMSEADSVVLSFTNGTRIIKTALVSRYQCWVLIFLWMENGWGHV